MINITESIPILCNYKRQQKMTEWNEKQPHFNNTFILQATYSMNKL